MAIAFAAPSLIYTSLPHAMTDPDWPTDAGGYNLLAKIGQGAFATVYKASTVSHETTCAIKLLNLDHVDTNLAEIRLEVQALRLSSHANVLTCHTAFCHTTQLWLVTPLMNKGSSLHCLQAARRLQPERKLEHHILYLLRETVLGLQYIHETNGQIHRDIKAGNILVDGNGDVKIADFGVSGWLVQGGVQNNKAKTFVGTPCWMAPEVMEQVNGYDTKADLWSLGITALELAKGYAPYAKYPPMKVLILTIQEDPPSLDSYDDEDDDAVLEAYSPNFAQLVRWLLQKNPAKRPSCAELLASSHFNTVQDGRQQLAELCQSVPDVADDVMDTSGPGHTPISILLPDEDRPAGTTWVFADGSHVHSSSANGTVDEVMEELDAFGKETGGEHYERTAEEGEQNDGLDDFMDEFEQTTGGEDFRRQG